MSEKITIKPERQESLAAPEQPELLAARATPEETPEKPAKHPAEAAHEARSVIAETAEHETQPNPLERLEAAEKAPPAANASYVNRELKQITLRRELKYIRRKLPAPQRLLSRTIHQPVIRAASEVAGKTVSRPSGLLGGGLVAFLGTTGYLVLAKQMGFEYNYAVFLALFVAGFIVGLALELLVHLATAGRRKAHD